MGGQWFETVVNIHASISSILNMRVCSVSKVCHDVSRWTHVLCSLLGSLCMEHCALVYVIKGGSSAGAPGTRPPVWKFLRVYFWKFLLQNMHNSFILMHKVCVKGHQKNLQTSKIIPHRDRPSWFFNSWVRHGSLQALFVISMTMHTVHWCMSLQALSVISMILTVTHLEKTLFCKICDSGYQYFDQPYSE